MDALKEYIEQLMDLKQNVTVKFRSVVDGGVSEVKGHIVSMDSVSHRDMFDMDSGLTIALDQILEINGRSFENIC